MNIEVQKVRLIERITHIDDPTIIDQINDILEQDESDFYEAHKKSSADVSKIRSVGRGSALCDK